jgi:hypothetical protein
MSLFFFIWLEVSLKLAQINFLCS